MACNHIDKRNERDLPSYESIIQEPSDNIEVKTKIIKNCHNLKNGGNSLTEYQQCSCGNQRTSEQINDDSVENKALNSEQCNVECSEDDILARNCISDLSQIDEIDITSIPREHNNWQVPKDPRISRDNSLCKDVSTITVLPGELHIDMDVDADLGSLGKDFVQPPPRYGSLIELILNDAPPNYSEATGVAINVDEIWVKKVQACTGRNRHSDDVRQIKCDRTCKLVTLALVVLIGIVAISFIAVTFI
eukprot:TCONS_00035185-protein